jgi:hypothetical protein
MYVNPGDHGTRNEVESSDHGTERYTGQISTLCLVN